MISEVQTTIVRTPDDRALCVEMAGDPAGRPVLVHIGTPNSRHLYGRWIEDAETRGIKLLSYDRPGYGGSTAQPGHSVADGAADVGAIADALDLDRIGVWGVSGGGPYALACAALLPELVVAAGVLGSIAPWGVPGLDYFAGMGEDNVEDIKLFFSDREGARRKGAKEREEALALTADQVVDAWPSLLSDTDAGVLTGDLAELFVRHFQEGLAPGDQGWWDDSVSHLTPWGFELAAIRVPVKIWHGRQDRFVPVQHGEWLAEHVPCAETDLSDTDGHLTLLVNRIPEVHEWLLSHLLSSTTAP
jgi:pimeloyl-ACP methyl ester carboxylesterase